jgi:predicted DNA binding CopG/RHH family protein
MKRPVQYFTDDYLEQCKSIKPEQIVEFLENFRSLHDPINRTRGKSKLISLKVPENLLSAFKVRAQTEGVPYQTQIKKLMQEWVLKKP